MTGLSDLYDADLFVRYPAIQRHRARIDIPHPLHGVEYADGAIVCGRASCEPCREYERTHPRPSAEERLLDLLVALIHGWEAPPPYGSPDDYDHGRASAAQDLRDILAETHPQVGVETRLDVWTS